MKNLYIKKAENKNTRTKFVCKTAHFKNHCI